MPVINKIYTRTGDKGSTGTLRGRIEKSDLLAEALGSVDELNSWIGVCRRAIGEETKMEAELERIQQNLLTIGSGIAGSGKKLKPGETNRLETQIDQMTAKLPQLGGFILPTGLGGAAEIQIARAIARRAERAVVGWGQATPSMKRYLNRLSDWLFTAARWMNANSGGKEEKWKPIC